MRPTCHHPFSIDYHHLSRAFKHQYRWDEHNDNHSHISTHRGKHWCQDTVETRQSASQGVIKSRTHNTKKNTHKTPSRVHQARKSAWKKLINKVPSCIFFFYDNTWFEDWQPIARVCPVYILMVCQAQCTLKTICLHYDGCLEVFDFRMGKGFICYMPWNIGNPSYTNVICLTDARYDNGID